MAIRERLYNIDDLWRIVRDADDDKRFELIEGELIEMPPPGEEHGFLAGEIYFMLRLYEKERKLGILTVDAGYYSPDDPYTLLSPDVAFRRMDRHSPPLTKKWAPVMPDLAVEIKSPSNTIAELRRKAGIYLRHGAQLVWIVMPDAQSVEVCRLDADGDMQSEVIGRGGTLSGEDVLPGFALPLAKLFA